MRIRSLVSLFCIALVTGCAVQHSKVADPEDWRRGIAQTAQGKYVVCELCPTKTPKTPYRPERSEAAVDSLPAAGGEPTADSPSVPPAINTSKHTETVDRMTQRPGEANGATSSADDAGKRLPATSQPLLTLRFPFDVARLQAEHRQELAEFAANVWPTLQVKSLVVVGHTDDIGPQAYNDSLALKRAENVASVLRELGVRPVHTEAEGKCCYVADNETPQGRALNRRAEIRLFVNPKESTQ